MEYVDKVELVGPVVALVVLVHVGHAVDEEELPAVGPFGADFGALVDLFRNYRLSELVGVRAEDLEAALLQHLAREIVFLGVNDKRVPQA